jgi:hypothetical protein
MFAKLLGWMVLRLRSDTTKDICESCAISSRCGKGAHHVRACPEPTAP